MTTQPVAEPDHRPVAVIGGVDTHKNTHYAAAVDDQGRLLGHREFPANDRGYQQLLAWMHEHFASSVVSGSGILAEIDGGAS